MTMILQCKNLNVGYGQRAIISGMNLKINTGEIVALLGPNGAGKTSSLLTIAGGLPPISGEISLFGAPCSSPLYQRVRNGMGFITDERSLIFGLTARDNLRLRGGSVEGALAYFPELEEHLDRQAALLSGGQQQMLALGRALAAKPKLLLADELSLGLAPKMVQRLLKSLRAAADDGLAILLVEQHVSQALKIADYALILGQGKIMIEGKSANLKPRLAEIENSYLGNNG